MKVIDLLNKIAKGEKVPRKFTYNGYLCEYDINNKTWFYYFGEGKSHRFDKLFYLNLCLNDEIEIIEDPILTDKEREYLKAVIEPYDVTSIRKYKWDDCEEYISIEVESSVLDYWAIELPTFKKGTRYKGMELDRYYTVEELDLEED